MLAPPPAILTFLRDKSAVRPFESPGRPAEARRLGAEDASLCLPHSEGEDLVQKVAGELHLGPRRDGSAPRTAERSAHSQQAAARPRLLPVVFLPAPPPPGGFPPGSRVSTTTTIFISTFSFKLAIKLFSQF